MTEEAGEGLKVPEGEVLKFWKEPSSAPPRNPCPGCTVREDDAFEGGKYILLLYNNLCHWCSGALLLPHALMQCGSALPPCHWLDWHCDLRSVNSTLSSHHIKHINRY